MHISKEKLVSCIIPSHNRQDLVGRALESVISQTYKNLEIIVVDDASQDDTEFIIRGYMDNDNRVKYIKNPSPKGGSGARNVGIKKARGQYIAFLDDDDEWMKDKIEKQVFALKEFDAVVCAFYVNDKKKIIRYPKTVIQLNDLRKANVLGGTSILMSRSSVAKITLFDEDLTNGQDWDLLIRIARRFSVRYLKKPLVIYNIGAHRRITNESTNMPLAELEKRMGVIYKHKEFFGDFWFSYHIARTLLSYIRHRDNKFKHISYTIKRCGILAVLRVLINRIYVNVVRS